MKLLIISDVHGEYQTLVNVLAAEPDADAIVFLGDGLQEAYLLEEDKKCPPIYAVRGNCDYSYAVPSEAFTAFCGVTVFYTHGNGYDVKWTMAGIKAAARAKGAEVILFGHTHISYYEHDDGMYVFNPGSVSRPRTGAPTYGIIEVGGGALSFKHRKVPT